MTVTTKAALAAELGISKARVSQYVKRGLPVRSDGKLDREEAVKWVADSHADSGRERHGGVKRANAIARRASPVKRKPLNPLVETEPNALGSVGVALLNGLAEMVARSGACAARAALDAGASTRTAYAVENLVAIRLGEEAESLLDEAGVYRSVVAFEQLVDPLIQQHALDWTALAAGAGESFDEDAWHGDVDAVMFPPESSHA